MSHELYVIEREDDLRKRIKELEDIVQELIEQAGNEHVSEFMDEVVDKAKAILEP